MIPVFLWFVLILSEISWLNKADKEDTQGSLCFSLRLTLSIFYIKEKNPLCISKGKSLSDFQKLNKNCKT